MIVSDVLRLSWLVLGLSWACSGVILGLFWGSLGLVLGFSRACYGLILGLWLNNGLNKVLNTGHHAVHNKGPNKELNKVQRAQ